jgi:copper chaperone CopZ
MKKVLNVDGMTCDHCVTSIKQEIESQVGVLGVEVNLEKKQVIIELNATNANVEDLIVKITELGFQVKM